jgi:hypothetical protein
VRDGSLAVIKCIVSPIQLIFVCVALLLTAFFSAAIMLNETNGNAFERDHVYNVTLYNYNAPGTQGRASAAFSSLPASNSIDMRNQLLFLPADAVVGCSVLAEAGCGDVVLCSVQATSTPQVFEVIAASLTGKSCSGTISVTVN